jgi:hypothetical protein
MIWGPMSYKNKEKQRASQHNSYLANKKRIRDRWHKARIRNKNYVDEYKRTRGCSCGETDVACLDLHHVGKKELKIAQAVRDWSLNRLKAEVERCEVVCANCHREIHAKDCLRITNNVKRQRNRAYVDEYHRTHACEMCGEPCSACLDFHHPGHKEVSINRAICDWGLKRLRNEVEACQVLCVNCHRKLHNADSQDQGLVQIEECEKVEKK